MTVLGRATVAAAVRGMNQRQPPSPSNRSPFQAFSFEASAVPIYCLQPGRSPETADSNHRQSPAKTVTAVIGDLGAYLEYVHAVAA